MRALCRPALSMAARIWSGLGVSANFTYTSVPPLKSTPQGRPFQAFHEPAWLNIDTSPATLKISENPRKNHFFPSQSMVGSLKNSIWPLNTQRFPALLSVQNCIKNDPRDEHRREQVGQQA